MVSKIKVTILILLAFVLGTLTTQIYAQTVQLIEVPATINGYSTIDLLNYLAQLKEQADISKFEANTPMPTPPVQKNGGKIIISSGVHSA